MSSLFGISCSSDLEGLNDIVEILKNSKLKALDINGEYSAKMLSKISSSISLLSVDDFISPIDIRNLITQKESLRRQFLLEFEKKLDSFPSNFAKFATIDFKAEECVGDTLYYGDLIKLTRKIAGHFKKKDITLCIPARMPITTAELSPEYYRRFLTDLMLPNCLIALEIHPHEMKRKEELISAFKNYRFDIGVLRFKYEANSGNSISPTLFSEILNAIEIVPYEPPCFFDPMKYEFNILRREILALSELIR